MAAGRVTDRTTDRSRNPIDALAERLGAADYGHAAHNALPDGMSIHAMSDHVERAE